MDISAVAHYPRYAATSAAESMSSRNFATLPARIVNMWTQSDVVRLPAVWAIFLDRRVWPNVESDLILVVGEGGSVHKVGYGHNGIEW